MADSDKKKLLFVINNLNVGGAEKALVSLLNELDYSQFEVDLQLFKNQGLFLKDVPKEVKILPELKYYRYFDGPYTHSLRTLNPKLIYYRYRFVNALRKGSNASEKEQLSWKQLRPMLTKVDKEYDVAIGYLEKNPTYFVVDKVKAKKKIGYIHNDYRHLGLNKKFDEPYFKKLDFIATVSDECIEILRQEFPAIREKFKLVQNIVFSEQVLEKANESINNKNWLKSKFKILSVGRLELQKNYQLAFESLALLKSKGYDFDYFILGNGSLETELKSFVTELNMEDRIHFLGIDSNPYKYINDSDLILQTSAYEGKSIVIDEAKIFCKPIILTDYQTAKDQITDGETGLIAEMTPESVAEKIEMIMNSNELRNHLIEELKNKTKANSGLGEFLKLIE
ncbi:MAG: glycosyltransferase [Moheibacter sp.]